MRPLRGVELVFPTSLIDFSKRREPAASHIVAWIDAGDTLGVCAINVAEFYAGLSQQEASTWGEFISSLTYWPISTAAAMRAGQDRYAFARAGTILTTADALVAAVAREYEAILVTANVDDYPMDDITLFALLPSSPPKR